MTTDNMTGIYTTQSRIGVTLDKELWAANIRNKRISSS